MATEAKQSSGVETKEAPRPPDDAVVTDELKESGRSQPEAAADDDDAKPGDDKQSGSNGENSASRDTKDTDPAKREASERRSAGKKIRRLQRQLAAERDRNNANERKIAELEQSINDLKSSSVKAEPEPKLDDFKTPQEYAKAYAKWEKAQSSASSSQPDKRQPPDTDKRGRDDTSSRQSGSEPAPDDKALTAFLERGKQKLGDEFLVAQEAAAANEFAVNRVMGDFILESDVGPELYVFLSDNPELSREIYDKSETYAIRELEKLEAKAKKGELIADEISVDDDTKSGKGKGDEDKAGKNAGAGSDRPGDTKAPDAPDSSDRGTASSPSADLEELSMEEYAERRRKQLSAQHRH